MPRLAQDLSVIVPVQSRSYYKWNLAVLTPPVKALCTIHDMQRQLLCPRGKQCARRESQIEHYSPTFFFSLFSSPFCMVSNFKVPNGALYSHILFLFRMVSNFKVLKGALYSHILLLFSVWCPTSKSLREHYSPTLFFSFSFSYGVQLQSPKGSIIVPHSSSSSV